LQNSFLLINFCKIRIRSKALSENYAVGSRASGFGSGKDVEAGVFEQYVDANGRSQRQNKPLEARYEFSDTA